MLYSQNVPKNFFSVVPNVYIKEHGKCMLS